MPGQFRCAFFARDYEASRIFYGDGLGLEEVESWDRGPGDRGTIYRAAEGRVEVLARPERPEAGAGWDYRRPAGVTLVIEVPDADAAFRQARARGLVPREGLRDQPWGHRSFLLEDPDGLVLYLFSEPEGDGR